MPESAPPARAPFDVCAIASVIISPDISAKAASEPDYTATWVPLTQPQPAGVETLLRFAHLSDPHLTGLEDVRWGALRGKRVLGYLSWWRKRRQLHQRVVLDAITRDALDGCPEHVAVTGDLTHIGLAAEHAAAREWLAQLEAVATVSLAPGNHDLYAADSARSMYDEWASYLPSPGGWPGVHKCGAVHFITLCSGAPSEALFAHGRLDDAQLAATGAALQASQGAVRVLLIHHSPHPASHPPRKQLHERGALIELLAAHGAELILHGHAHRAMLHPLVAGRFRIPVLGAPSASVASATIGRAGGYHRIVIERVAGLLQARVVTRRWTQHGIVTSAALTLRLGDAR